MPDYLFLMHNDTQSLGQDAATDWPRYLGRLQELGVLQGGSAIGKGACVRKAGAAPPVTEYLTGFIRVEAADLEQARGYLVGNPVFEAGGTVEIRELPRTE